MRISASFSHPSRKKMKGSRSCLDKHVKGKSNVSKVCKFSFCCGKCWGPGSILRYLYSASRFQKLLEMFSEINFMAKLYWNKTVWRKAKIRKSFKTARLPFCIFFAERTKGTLSQSSLPTRVFSEDCFLLHVIFHLEEPWWQILRLTKAKLLDYSIVPAINLVCPLF